MFSIRETFPLKLNFPRFLTELGITDPNANGNKEFKVFEDDLISIRPNQFSLYDEDLASGKKVFVGKIESIREVALEHKIKLKCKDLSLKVSLNSQIELSIGQELKLMAP